MAAAAMTQIRPRIADDLAAEVQAYADSYGISFDDAMRSCSGRR